MWITNLFRAAIFATILIAPQCSYFGGPVSAAPQAIASKKDLNAALKSARTPDDHKRIASYYKEQAEKLQSKEKEERELANYYFSHPTLGKQYPTPYQNHKGLADYYQLRASEAAEKADLQTKLAREADIAR
jgi:hypothetical protein